MTTTLIVWNGTDSYIEASEATKRNGYDFDGSHLYTQTQKHKAFEATEVFPSPQMLEEDLTDIYVTESGRYYV